MRILHSADIHLAPRLDYIADRARRAQRREDFARQVDRLPELAREHAVDAVVLAGDVFDRDLPGQPEAARLAAALGACGVPVLVTPGTHDAWRPGGVWDRPWPVNVTVFSSDEWQTVVVGDTAFHGLASLGRARQGGLLGGLPRPSSAARFQVGIAHASMLWADVAARVDPKNLPFEEAELDRCGFHYLALGDHHRMRVVNRGAITAAYPGSPEGLSLDPAEAGPRHMLLVELTEPGRPPEVTSIAVNQREILLDEIPLDDLQHESAGDLAEAVRRQLLAAARPDRLARFDLTGVIHHPLGSDPGALGDSVCDRYFLLQVRDRTRTMPEAPVASNTIRGAFERRLRARLEAAVEEPERQLAERALAIGLQSLEGLLVKLTRLVMHGFRSYREPVEVRFEPGVNVFLGRNEAGKTGILLAIQAALYAPRSAVEREALVADGSDICQVALEYSLPDGREFRVDRDLVHHKGSIAECREGSWLTLATSVGDIAQVVREHTGCDDALFRATLLVRHEGVEVGDADDLTRSLSERIELLVSGSPGGISAARAVKKLETHVKELSGPRAGLVMAAETRLREAESALASANSAVRRLADGSPRLEELSERSRVLESELADADAVLERARRVASLETRRAELQAGRAAIDRALDARAELTRLDAEATAARARVPAGRRPHPGLPTSWRGWPHWVLAGILLLGGLLVALLGQVPTGAALALIGIGLAAAARLLPPSPLRPVADLEAERLAREAERRRDLAEGALRSLDQRPEAELTADRSRLGRDLEETEAQLAEAAIHRLEPADLARREVRAQQLPALIRAAVEARIRCEVELQSLENAAASLAELEDEVEVARRDLERLRLKLAAMRLAREELEAAIQDIRQGVGPDLAAAATSSLAGVAPGYSVALAECPGLSFQPAGPGGEALGRRQLSDGTVDQFHFAVRVALADVLLGELRPPLLLDDPFRYADADRRAALHLMLATIGEDRQVVYFTVEDPAPLPVTHRLPVVASRVGSE